MYEENVVRVRSGINAWIRSGYRSETFRQVGVFAPDVEWDISAYPLPDWPNVGAGTEELERLLTLYVDGWQDYRAEPREMVALQDQVVMALHEIVSMGGSDDTLERDLHLVWTVRDGVVVMLRVFPTRAQALEAAGLSS